MNSKRTAIYTRSKNSTHALLTSRFLSNFQMSGPLHLFSGLWFVLLISCGIIFLCACALVSKGKIVLKHLKVYFVWQLLVACLKQTKFIYLENESDMIVRLSEMNKYETNIFYSTSKESENKPLYMNHHTLPLWMNILLHITGCVQLQIHNAITEWFFLVSALTTY